MTEIRQLHFTRRTLMSIDQVALQPWRITKELELFHIFYVRISHTHTHDHVLMNVAL